MTDKYCQRPTGKLEGDSKDLPYKGTSTGMSGANTNLDGNGIGKDDTNSRGGISGATGSDRPDQDKASRKPRI